MIFYAILYGCLPIKEEQVRSKKYISFLTQRRHAAIIAPTKSYELLHYFSIAERNAICTGIYGLILCSNDVSYPQAAIGGLLLAPLAARG